MIVLDCRQIQQRICCGEKSERKTRDRYQAFAQDEPSKHCRISWCMHPKSQLLLHNNGILPIWPTI